MRKLRNGSVGCTSKDFFRVAVWKFWIATMNSSFRWEIVYSVILISLEVLTSDFKGRNIERNYHKYGVWWVVRAWTFVVNHLKCNR